MFTKRSYRVWGPHYESTLPWPSPRIYISWAMLISSEFGETAAYGLCVLYILGSGLAKLRIGGLGELI